MHVVSLVASRVQTDLDTWLGAAKRTRVGISSSAIGRSTTVVGSSNRGKSNIGARLGSYQYIILMRHVDCTRTSSASTVHVAHLVMRSTHSFLVVAKCIHMLCVAYLIGSIV